MRLLLCCVVLHGWVWKWYFGGRTYSFVCVVCYAWGGWVLFSVVSGLRVVGFGFWVCLFGFRGLLSFYFYFG